MILHIWPLIRLFWKSFGIDKINGDAEAHAFKNSGVTPRGHNNFCVGAVIVFVVSMTYAGTLRGDEPPEVALSVDGEAQLPVVVSPEAPPEVRDVADLFIDYLQRITDAEYSLSEGDAESGGIMLGLSEDFDELPFDPPFSDTVDDREAYLLRTTDRTLYIISATPLGLERAVWDMLYRVGYRHFFPSPAWEIVPDKPDLSVAVDAVERPDYLHRSMSYGYGSWMRQGPDYGAWARRNRMSHGGRSSVQLQTGHAYAGIANKHEDVFEENPEWLALVDGERKRLKNSQKFCNSNPELREFMAEMAIKVFEKNPERDSISRDPSDLHNWCECENCEELGSITDQAVTLANDAAEAITERFGDDKFVGMYAYNLHSPPPNIEVHPNVVVSIASSFIRGGYTLEELIDGWSDKASILGIREYWSVHAWDRDLPGRARGSRPGYMQRTIPQFFDSGVRFMTAEASENWGPNGLPYYLASRFLWDCTEAENLDELVDDFLDRAFGPAAGPMRSFYEIIDGASELRLSDHLVGSMYRSLARAREKGAGHDAVMARLDELALYTRYVELFRAYSSASGDERQEAFGELMKFAWRIRKTGMIDSIAAWRDIARRDSSVSFPEGRGVRVDEQENPWKSNEPFSSKRIDAIISEGIEANPVLEFEPVSYSDELVPASRLDLPVKSFAEIFDDGHAHARATQIGHGHRGKQEYYLWLDEPGEIEMGVAGGQIAKYRDRGNVKLRLFSPEEPSLDPVDADDSTPPDGQEYDVSLTTSYRGLHILEVDDGHDRTRLTWPENVCVTAKGPHKAGRWYLYFYVPKGTEEVVGYTNHLSGFTLGADGTKVFDFAEKMDAPGYFHIPVPEGHDGALWKFHHVLGNRTLMNVPPYFAGDGDELLLPIEVIEADSQ